MANVMSRAWWTLLLRGVLAIILGLLLLFAPGLTLATGAFSFAILFGVFVLIEGVVTIYSAVTRREGQWFLLLLFGVISVLAGLAALGNPFLFGTFSLLIMVYIISFRAIAGGLVEIMAAWQVRKQIDNEWLLILNGAISVLFGLLLLFRPIASLEVLVLIAAFYLLIIGVMLCIFAFRVRGWAATLQGKVDQINASQRGA
jgi:uncharacterized membrane protein HdeD (DUF308 family)